MQKLTLKVVGRVQGVSYRAFTKAEAIKIGGITGTVKNLPDGSVEMIAFGDKQALQCLVESCKKGPPLSKVTELVDEWIEYSGDLPPDFIITY